MFTMCVQAKAEGLCNTRIEISHISNENVNFFVLFSPESKPPKKPHPPPSRSPPLFNTQPQQQPMSVASIIPHLATQPYPVVYTQPQYPYTQPYPYQPTYYNPYPQVLSPMRGHLPPPLSPERMDDIETIENAYDPYRPAMDKPARKRKDRDSGRRHKRHRSDKSSRNGESGRHSEICGGSGKSRRRKGSPSGSRGSSSRHSGDMKRKKSPDSGKGLCVFLPISKELKILDWDIAKSIGFCLVEMVRFVPNSPPQAPKIVELHFYVILIHKNANVTSFRKTILRKALKIAFYGTLRPDQNCNTPKMFFR
jgi:hypothetical protein